MKQLIHYFLFACLLMLLGCNAGGSGTGSNFVMDMDKAFVGTDEVVEDPNGPKMYRLASINNQTWFMENSLAIVRGSWCYENKGINCGNYGRLYSASGARFACKAFGAGWRLPTVEEWKAVLMNYGGYIDEDNQPKGRSPEEALKLLAPTTSGMGLKLGGVRSVEGAFTGLDEQSFIWTSSEADPYKNYYGIVYDKDAKGIRISRLPKEAGGLCRCIR